MLFKMVKTTNQLLPRFVFIKSQSLFRGGASLLYMTKAGGFGDAPRAGALRRYAITTNSLQLGHGVPWCDIGIV
jgi:hypothetical protein